MAGFGDLNLEFPLILAILVFMSNLDVMLSSFISCNTLFCRVLVFASE